MMKDFQRDYVKDHLGVLSPDNRIKGLSPDEVLNRFPLEEIQQYLKNKQNKKDS
jgi:hypothetical protein